MNTTTRTATPNRDSRNRRHSSINLKQQTQLVAIDSLNLFDDNDTEASPTGIMDAPSFEESFSSLSSPFSKSRPPRPKRNAPRRSKSNEDHQLHFDGNENSDGTTTAMASDKGTIDDGKRDPASANGTGRSSRRATTGMRPSTSLQSLTSSSRGSDKQKVERSRSSSNLSPRLSPKSPRRVVVPKDTSKASDQWVDFSSQSFESRKEILKQQLSQQPTRANRRSSTGTTTTTTNTTTSRRERRQDVDNSDLHPEMGSSISSMQMSDSTMSSWNVSQVTKSVISPREGQNLFGDSGATISTRSLNVDAIDAVAVTNDFPKCSFHGDDNFFEFVRVPTKTEKLVDTKSADTKPKQAPRQRHLGRSNSSRSSRRRGSRNRCSSSDLIVEAATAATSSTSPTSLFLKEIQQYPAKKDGRRAMIPKTPRSHQRDRSRSQSRSEMRKQASPGRCNRTAVIVARRATSVDNRLAPGEDDEEKAGIFEFKRVPAGRSQHDEYTRSSSFRNRRVSGRPSAPPRSRSQRTSSRTKSRSSQDDAARGKSRRSSTPTGRSATNESSNTTTTSSTSGATIPATEIKTSRSGSRRNLLPHKRSGRSTQS